MAEPAKSADETSDLGPPSGWEETQGGTLPVDGSTIRRTTAVPLRDGPPAIPGFEIIDELGRGAMGVVYKARQVALNRIVALKMILSGEGATEKDLHRFQTEAEASAALQHPNVAQVYEIGRHDGLAYFALEYCPGGTLSQRLRDHLQTPREAAELVRTLAVAIQAAHDRGVLHRDLKPANILLSTDPAAPLPVPKVADFGMAKRFDPGTGVEASGFTLAGTIIGTPSYMAPEQTEGRATRASDVYSLGAILYECLTGRPPFREATALDTLCAVLADEPVPPTKLAGKIPPDLEAICLKCLEKPAEKRYESAGALAEDLGRFLDGLPTHARPAGQWEKLVKWAKRRPAVAGLLATGLFSLLMLAALSVGLWRAVKEAGRQRDRAVNTVNIALSAVDGLLEQEDLPGSSDPEVQRQAMLDAVTRSLEKLGNYAGDDGELLGRGFKATMRRGRLLVDTGKLPDAVAAYQKAINLSRTQWDQSHEIEWQRRLASALNRMGGVYDRTRDAVKADAAYDEAEKIRRELAVGGNSDDVHDLAVTLYNRANVDSELSQRTDSAQKRFDESLGLLEKLTKEHPGQPRYRDSLAQCWFNFARHLSRQTGGMEDAFRALDNAKRIWLNLTEEDPASALYLMRLAMCLNEIGRLRHLNGEPAVAFDNYTAALKSWRELVRRHPKVATYQGLLGLTCSNIAKTDVPGNPADERLKLGREAVKLLTAAQSLPTFREPLADAYFGLAKLQFDNGALEDARRAIDQAVAIYDELATQFPRITALHDKLELARRERDKIRERRID